MIFTRRHIYSALGIAILSLFFWSRITRWVNGPTLFADALSWAPTLLLFTLIVSGIVLVCVLFKDYSYILATSVPLYLTFSLVVGFNLAGLAVGLLLVLFHGYGFYRIREELERSTVIDIWTTTRRTIFYIILPLMMLISLAYFEAPAVQKAAQQGVLPNNVQRSLEAIANRAVISTIVPSSREFDAIGHKTLVDGVLDQIYRIVRPYIQFLPAVLAFGLFLILQGFSIIFIFLGAFFTSVLFMLLRKTKLVRIKKVQKAVEIVEV